MKKTVLMIASVGILALLMASTVLAIDYAGIGSQPANPRADNPRTNSIFIYNINPGEQKSDGIKIFNNTDSKKTISVNAVDSVIASGGSFACAQEVEPKLDVGAWINLSSNSVVLAPGASVVVPFTITAPVSADVGEHDGCITVQEVSPTSADSSQDNGVVLSFRSAIRVVATIPGEITKELSLRSVAVSQTDDGKILIVPTARNNGNVSLDAKISVSLKTIFGTEVASNGGTYPILSHSIADWNFDFAEPFWGGLYRADVVATYNTDTSAELGKDGAGDKSISLSSAVFYAPPSLMAGLIELAAVAAILAGLVHLINRKIRRRRISKNWASYIVQVDDSITSVASKYHIRWKRLALANNLKAPYVLRTGDRLKVPKLASRESGGTKHVTKHNPKLDK